MSRRVVITGLGLVTPVGIGKDSTWNALCGGISGVDKIIKFDTSELKTKIAGEVKDFDASLYMDGKEAN
ncbi:MAG: beta-ketoacyl synthase N-terminal-like domain-containing protein, partial [Thermodesulfobacteriota bacterium]